MISPAILSLLTGGLLVSILHGVLPTHWLPLALAGRSQQWSLPKTLAVSALAGGGHVLVTTILGGVLVWIGKGLLVYFSLFSSVVVSGLLTVLGILYVANYFRGRRQGHGHHHAVSDRTAFLSLAASLTFSPCEAFLPIYLSAAPHGWGVFAALAAILAVGTLGGMLILVTLTFKGMGKLHSSPIEKYEALILGLILVLLGVSAAILDH